MDDKGMTINRRAAIQLLMTTAQRELTTIDATDHVGQSNDPNIEGTDLTIAYQGDIFSMRADDAPYDRSEGVVGTAEGHQREEAGATIALLTNAMRFDVLGDAWNAATGFDVIVDGELIDGDGISRPSDGSLEVVHIDLAKAGLKAGVHTFDLIYAKDTAFRGLKLPEEAILKPLIPMAQRIVVLEALSTDGLSSFGSKVAAYVGRGFGGADVWRFGTQSHAKDDIGDRDAGATDHALSAAVAAHADVYVLSFTPEADDTPDRLFETAIDIFKTLTNDQPEVKICVIVGPVANDADRKIDPDDFAAIQKATELFPAVHFLDANTLADAAPDTPQPEQTTHDVLAQWLEDQIGNVAHISVRLPANLFFQDADSSEVESWKIATDTIAGGASFGTTGSQWTALASDDFSGSDTADILFRDTTGFLATWSTRGTALIGGGMIGNPGPDWTWLATGDFNGDGKADLAFLNTVSGEYATWDLSGAAIIGGGTIGTAQGFTFAAAGDLDGDGKADMLFKGTDGTYAAWLINDARIVGGGVIGNPGTGYELKGLGDFNGDGKADMLFQNVDGTLATWDMNGIAITGGGMIGNPSANWQLTKIIDLDQDGKSDLVFVNAEGQYATWLIDDVAITGGTTLGGVPSTMHLIG